MVVRAGLAILACGWGVRPSRWLPLPAHEPMEFLTPRDADAEQPAATANFTFLPEQRPASTDPSIPLSPPMTYQKYVTMSKKRVVVTIRYSGGSGYKTTYEAAAAILKARFPDVLISKNVLEVHSVREEDQFDILVDGKLAYVKRRDKPGVYLQMRTLAQFISRARRRRRPDSLVYGDVETYKPEQQVLAQQLREEIEAQMTASADDADVDIGVGESIQRSLRGDKRVVEELSNRWVEMIEDQRNATYRTVNGESQWKLNGEEGRSDAADDKAEVVDVIKEVAEGKAAVEFMTVDEAKAADDGVQGSSPGSSEKTQAKPDSSP